MAANQRKPRDIVVEYDLPAPASFAVALLAAVAELALMRLILLVARQTGRRQFVSIEIAGMACVAFDFDVGTSKRKLRHLVMVETYGLPLRGGMASLAFDAVATSVCVL